MFEQSKSNKEFVIMNHVWRQNVKTDAEKDFYKLMNNSNFGYDCQNNADNCYLTNIGQNRRAFMCQKISKCIWSRFK